MTVEIRTVNQQEIIMELSISRKARVRLRSYPPNTVPTGYDAQFEIDGQQGKVRDYRERPGKTAGATVFFQETSEMLDPKNPIAVIGNITFSYRNP